MTEGIPQEVASPETQVVLPAAQDFYLALDQVVLEIASCTSEISPVLTPEQEAQLDQALARSASVLARRLGPLVSLNDVLTPEEIAEREQILADFPDLNDLTPKRQSQILFEHTKAGILTAWYADVRSNRMWTSERLRMRRSIMMQYLVQALSRDHH